MSPSFSLTPVGSGLTGTVWQCTFIGNGIGGIDNPGDPSVNYIVNGTFSYVGGQMKGTYNISGDYTSPTRFYGVSGSQDLYFRCGDFVTFNNARFSFTRIF